MPQCGHFAETCGGFAGRLSGLFPEFFPEIFPGLLDGLGNSASIHLLAAGLANAINLERVAGGDVVVFASDLVFDFSDFLRKKFHRSAALGAHHVVMAAAVVLVFVARDAVVKGNFTGQAATRQKLQRPVDSGEADARVGFLHQPMQLVGRKMFAGFEKGPQNGVALFGLLQADATKMLQENTFGFADVLP